MSRGTHTRATRKPVVVLAGEDASDRLSLRVLLEATCPDMRGRIVEIKDPVRLRTATETRLAERVRTLARKARARALLEDAELACVFIHEDLDRVDGVGYPEARERVQKALNKELRSAHYVLAVAELEAWLLLFPDAITAFSSSWRVPAARRRKDTGRFADPKKVMKNEVSGPTRSYRESTAPDIFSKACDLKILDMPNGSNRSWQRFREDVSSCCTHHLGGGRRPQ
ncbi:hypothetical protein [Frankia gtarii]|uniref:hypothetical protein n=1 Tax=Frankia gtarii TaxID=2950102 RepID=UPI0021BF1D6B|nr:hypothetical protein [Frankia gtarii]